MDMSGEKSLLGIDLPLYAPGNETPEGKALFPLPVTRIWAQLSEDQARMKGRQQPTHPMYS